MASRSRRGLKGVLVLLWLCAAVELATAEDGASSNQATEAVEDLAKIADATQEKAEKAKEVAAEAEAEAKGANEKVAEAVEKLTGAVVPDPEHPDAATVEVAKDVPKLHDAATLPDATATENQLAHEDVALLDKAKEAGMEKVNEATTPEQREALAKVGHKAGDELTGIVGTGEVVTGHGPAEVLAEKQKMLDEVVLEKEEEANALLLAKQKELEDAMAVKQKELDDATVAAAAKQKELEDKLVATEHALEEQVAVGKKAADDALKLVPTGMGSTGASTSPSLVGIDPVAALHDPAKLAAMGTGLLGATGLVGAGTGTGTGMTPEQLAMQKLGLGSGMTPEQLAMQKLGISGMGDSPVAMFKAAMGDAGDGPSQEDIEKMVEERAKEKAKEIAGPMLEKMLPGKEGEMAMKLLDSGDPNAAAELAAKMGQDKLKELVGSKLGGDAGEMAGALMSGDTDAIKGKLTQGLGSLLGGGDEDGDGKGSGVDKMKKVAKAAKFAKGLLGSFLGMHEVHHNGAAGKMASAHDQYSAELGELVRPRDVAAKAKLDVMRSAGDNGTTWSKLLALKALQEKDGSVDPGLLALAESAVDKQGNLDANKVGIMVLNKQMPARTGEGLLAADVMKQMESRHQEAVAVALLEEDEDASVSPSSPSSRVGLRG